MMINILVVVSFFALLTSSSTAFACNGIFDIGCLGGAFQRGAASVGNAIQRGATNVGNAIGLGPPLTPLREYLRTRDIPPPGVGAYGIVILQSKPTPANNAKLVMVCKSFVAHFPRNDTSDVPISDRMITIWPLDNPDAAEAKADDCDFVLNHYDLNASESAINDARKQNGTFDGQGPYLIGWSPSNTRGVPDKLVLEVDMSEDNSQAMIDHKFEWWKNKIVEDPSAWRGGFSERAREAIKEFCERYGNDMLSAFKLVKGTG